MENIEFETEFKGDGNALSLNRDLSESSPSSVSTAERHTEPPFTTLRLDSSLHDHSECINDADLEHPMRSVTYAVGRYKKKCSATQIPRASGCFGWILPRFSKGKSSATERKKSKPNLSGSAIHPSSGRHWTALKLDTNTEVNSPIDSATSFKTAPDSVRELEMEDGSLADSAGYSVASVGTRTEKDTSLPRLYATLATRVGSLSRKRSVGNGRESSVTDLISPSSLTILKRGILAARTVHTSLSPDGQALSKRWKCYAKGWRLYEVFLKPKQLVFFANESVPPVTIPLEGQCSLSMYTQIDAVLVLTITYKSKHRFSLIFKANTINESHQWYMAINTQLPTPNVLLQNEVNVWMPEEELQLAVHLPETSPEASGALITWTVRDKVIELLQKRRKIVEASPIDRKSYAVVWKRLERLNWCVQPVSLELDNSLLINPFTIENSHRLEVCKIRHSSDSVRLPDGSELCRPPEAQGFLQKRCIKHPSVHTFVRFALLKGPLLFLVHPRHCHSILKGDRLQPVMTSDPLYNAGASSIHISTLSDDKFAILLKEATECIDLRQVVVVSAFTCSRDLSLVTKNANVPFWHQFFRQRYWRHTSQRLYETDGSHSLEIVLALSNGTCCIFKAASRADTLIWLTTLSQALTYWKAKTIVDFDNLARVQQHNFTLYEDYRVRQQLDAPQIVAENQASALNAFIPQSSNLLNSSEMLIQPTPKFQNVCLYRQCYFLRKEGILFVQNKPGHTFKSYYCLLMPGYLIMYKNVKASNRPCSWVKNGIFAPVNVNDDGLWRRYKLIKLHPYVFCFSGVLSKHKGREEAHKLNEKNAAQGGSSLSTKLITLPESIQHQINWSEYLEKGVHSCGDVRKPLDKQVASILAKDEEVEYPKRSIGSVSRYDSGVDVAEHALEEREGSGDIRESLHKMLLSSKTAFVVSDTQRSCSFSLFLPKKSRLTLLNEGRLNSQVDFSGGGDILSFRSKYKSDAQEWITALQLEIESGASA